MKLYILFPALTALLLIALFAALSSKIGIGNAAEFSNLIGLRRGLVFGYSLALVLLLCVYQAVSIGVHANPKTAKWRSVLLTGFCEGVAAFGRLTEPRAVRVARREWLTVGFLAIAFAVIFLIFLSKYRTGFESDWSLDQDWHQGFVDYDATWATPFFHIPGNILYNFDIRFPLNSRILPILSLSELFPQKLRLPVADFLLFFFAGLLFWFIGAIFKLRHVPRTVFAGLVALIVSVPAGIDMIFWLLQPKLFTRQFVFAIWWGEVPLLFVATVCVFYQLGQSQSLLRNCLIGTGFFFLCWLVIIGCPVGAVYFVPLILLYCLVFYFTSSTGPEWQWKTAVSLIVGCSMLAANVPRFFLDLYGYSFGVYFVEHTSLSSSFLDEFQSIWIFTSRGMDSFDWRGVFIYVVSMAAVIGAACRADGALRRFAIAIAVSETAIIIGGCLNILIFKIPLSFAYAQIAEAPLWGAFFVLICMATAMVVDRHLRLLLKTAPDHLRVSRLRWVRSFDDYRWPAYGSALTVVLLLYLVLVPLRQVNEWPPSRPRPLQLIENDIALLPGMPFRGRVFTAAAETTQNDAVMKYKRAMGNDFFTDFLAYNIPTINQYGHWTSPVYFVFLRSIFGHAQDGFSKTNFLMSGYDAKIARLIGVRYVVSNKPLNDGELIYSQTAEDTEFRLYRLDGTNVGQFSPTQPILIKTAEDAIGVLKSATFIPRRDVVVEEQLTGSFVPAEVASVTVEKGPVLHVRANSSGKSMLALPFEYSNCLRLQGPTSQQAQIAPVNLAETGLIFEGSVDVYIDYAFGVFTNASCRRADIERANRLRVRDALHVK